MHTFIHFYWDADSTYKLFPSHKAETTLARWLARHAICWKTGCTVNVRTIRTQYVHSMFTALIFCPWDILITFSAGALCSPTEGFQSEWIENWNKSWFSIYLLAPVHLLLFGITMSLGQNTVFYILGLSCRIIGDTTQDEGNSQEFLPSCRYDRLSLLLNTECFITGENVHTKTTFWTSYTVLCCLLNLSHIWWAFIDGLFYLDLWLRACTCLWAEHSSIGDFYQRLGSSHPAVSGASCGLWGRRNINQMGSGPKVKVNIHTYTSDPRCSHTGTEAFISHTAESTQKQADGQAFMYTCTLNPSASAKEIGSHGLD